MPERTPEIKAIDLICTPRIDRLQFLAEMRDEELPEIPEFQVRRDTFVRQQTSIRTYRRVRNCENPETKTMLNIQYQVVPPWLASAKITATGDDIAGLRRPELERVVRQFKDVRLLTVEMAFDFSKGSSVDRTFVLRHGIFGKSQLVEGRFYKDVRLGTRDSDTMVRGYEKIETSSFRVEIELHSSWLRRNNVSELGDLPRLAHLLLPKRLLFVRIDWKSLSRHLARKGLPAAKLVSQAKLRSHSIHRTMEYLRQELGLCNVRRFLRPLSINRTIQRELRIWADGWRRGRECNKTGGHDA